jgi:CBS domain-containing protein
MRVKDLMTAPAATVARGDSLHVADGIMSMGGVRHLPVLHGPELVGVISQRDILRAPGLLSPAYGFGGDARAVLKALRVEDVMSSAVVTIGAEAPVQVAAERLLEHRVGCLPVLDGATLVGIVTTSDLLRAMAGPSQGTDVPGGTAATGKPSAAPSLAETGT